MYYVVYYVSGIKLWGPRSKMDDMRDVFEYYFHLVYPYQVILLLLKRFHALNISMRTLKRNLQAFGLRRRGNVNNNILASVIQ
jgi:hypothetical protein